MAVNVIVNVEYDPNTREFTFTGGNTQADDGTVDFDAGWGNTVTYRPKDNVGIWFLTGVSWNPEGPLDWEWLEDKVNGSIVVFDENEPTNEPVAYSVTLNIEDIGINQAMAGGPVIINKPEYSSRSAMKMSSSS